MMDFIEELPSSIPVVMSREGREHLSIIKVGYRSVPTRCWNCWCFGHEIGKCRESDDGGVCNSALRSDEISPVNSVEEPSCTSQRKKRGRKGERSLKPDDHRRPIIGGQRWPIEVLLR